MESSLPGKCHPISLRLSAFRICGVRPGALSTASSLTVPLGARRNLPTHSPGLLSHTRSVSRSHTRLMKNRVVFFLLFFFLLLVCTNAHVLFIASLWFQVTSPKYLFKLDPLPMNLNTTYNVCLFSFFFSKSTHTQTLTCFFSNTHLETWPCHICFLFCPRLFLCFLLLFFL